MVSIKPFKGYRYAAGDISKLICPPYDVISEEHQRRLLELSPFNFVRLILGDDPQVEECRRDFQRIRLLFETWIRDGVMREEEKASIYVYSQVFDVGGEARRRTGIIPLVRLEDFREKHIYPHEKVISRHVEDRYALMEATKANFGMVFGIYADPDRSVDSLAEEVLGGKPLSSCTMDDVVHELWRMEDANVIERLRGEMADKKVYIADGHHRYTTALRYRDAHPEREDAKYVMMTLVNMYNEGLVIFPTHRLVRRGLHDTKRILAGIEDRFHIEPSSPEEMIARIRGKKFSYGFTCEGDAYVIRLRDPKALDAIPGRSEALKHLDVTVLHEMILKPIFGIDTEDANIEEKLTYVKGLPGTTAQRSTEDHAFGFFMNAVDMDEIVRVAGDHEVMPQKSTFFHPKVYSGLVVHRLS
jgi:uncharacterized protein (DUF1015 family)